MASAGEDTRAGRVLALGVWASLLHFCPVEGEGLLLGRLDVLSELMVQGQLSSWLLKPKARD